MGVDFNAIIGHTLRAVDLPTLPARLNADAAPALALAVRELARAKNRHYESSYQAHPLDKPFQPIAEDDKWAYEQPGYWTYYDCDGREYIPYLTKSEQTLIADQPEPGPPEWQEMSVEALWAKGDGVEIEGPAGLNLYITRNCLTLSCGTRWYTFLAEQNIQHPLRAVISWIGSLLASPFVIYATDSAYCSSIACDVSGEGTIDEVSTHLRQYCGPPAPSLAAITESYNGRPPHDGYFIDDFADLRAEKGQ